MYTYTSLHITHLLFFAGLGFLVAVLAGALVFGALFLALVTSLFS
jgi:hypothetical protein